MKIGKLFHRVVPSEAKCEGDNQKKFQRGFLRHFMHNLIDERALTILAKKIAQSSGDIRVAFDIMKTALEASLLKIQNLTAEDFNIDITDDKLFKKRVVELIEAKLSIDVELIIKCLDKLKPMNVRKLLTHLPRQDIFVLQSIAYLAEKEIDGESKPILLESILLDLQELEKFKGFQARTLAQR